MARFSEMAVRRRIGKRGEGTEIREEAGMREVGVEAKGSGALYHNASLLGTSKGRKANKEIKQLL